MQTRSIFAQLLIFKKMKKMKKIILSCAAVCAFCFANAQEKSEGLKKGDIVLTGLTNYSYDNYKGIDQKAKTFELAIESGFMVSNHVAIGGLTGFKNVKMDQSGNNVSDVSVFNGGAFLRYFYSPEKKLSFYNDFQAIYSRAVDNNNTNKTADGIGGVISVGAIYWLGQNFGIQASFAGLTYSSASLDKYDTAPVEGFSVGGNLAALKFGGFFKF